MKKRALIVSWFPIWNVNSTEYDLILDSKKKGYEVHVTFCGKSSIYCLANPSKNYFKCAYCTYKNSRIKKFTSNLDVQWWDIYLDEFDETHTEVDKYSEVIENVVYNTLQTQKKDILYQKKTMNFTF